MRNFFASAIDCALWPLLDLAHLAELDRNALDISWEGKGAISVSLPARTLSANGCSTNKRTVAPPDPRSSR